MGGVLTKGDFPDTNPESNEVLLERCDAIRDRERCQARAYKATLPPDVMVRLVLHGLLTSIGIVCIVMSPWVLGSAKVPHSLKQQSSSEAYARDALGAVCLVCLLWLLMLLGQLPRRVVRKADELVFEFMAYHYSVPIDDVLELIVLSDGSQFRQLLRKWQVFPYGRTICCFFGARSSLCPVCVLLTRRFLWSFIFTLQDPVQFLLDNQRPLDTQALYRTTLKACLRAEESLDSERIGTVLKGRYLRVKEQRGRRIYVSVENSELCGWMSYITAKGTSLLAKQREGALVPGSIGASELAKTNDVELTPCRSAGGAE